MSEGNDTMDTMIKLDVDADYNEMQPLAVEIVSRINEYRAEWKMLDENDSLWDYYNGLISAYQSVAGMIGVPMEVYYDESDL
jgi:hypothetical protein